MPNTNVTPHSELKPLLTDVKGIAKMLCTSRASIYRRETEGLMPAARKFGGSRLYEIAEIASWVKHGMPCRKVWEEMKKTGKAVFGVFLSVLIGSLFPRR